MRIIFTLMFTIKSHVYHVYRSSINSQCRLCFQRFCYQSLKQFKSSKYYLNHVLDRKEYVASILGLPFMMFSSWWRHQMKTFSSLLALCDGNPPVTGGFPSQKPVTRIYDVPLICAWANGWAKTRDSGDLKRHRAHYDVTLMFYVMTTFTRLWPLS